jgi:hypothetical protein
MKVQISETRLYEREQYEQGGWVEMSGKKKAQNILTSLTFLTVLAALGCGTYSPVAPSQETLLPGVENPLFVRLLPASKDSDIDPSLVATKLISAAEGGVVSNEYYSLYFPPGALEEDTEITIEMPEFPLAVVRLGPHGITFKKEVTLSLPLGVVETEASDYGVLWYNEETGLWEYIGSYIEDDILKAGLEHFSEYGSDPKKTLP